jgi:hypothetical protein
VENSAVCGELLCNPCEALCKQQIMGDLRQPENSSLELGRLWMAVEMSDINYVLFSFGTKMFDMEHFW